MVSFTEGKVLLLFSFGPQACKIKTKQANYSGVVFIIDIIFRAPLSLKAIFLCQILLRIKWKSGHFMPLLC